MIGIEIGKGRKREIGRGIGSEIGKGRENVIGSIGEYGIVICCFFS